MYFHPMSYCLFRKSLWGRACACDGLVRVCLCHLIHARVHVWLTPSWYSFSDSRHIIYPNREACIMACIIQDLIKLGICGHCHRNVTHWVCNIGLLSKDYTHLLLRHVMVYLESCRCFCFLPIRMLNKVQH